MIQSIKRPDSEALHGRRRVKRYVNIAPQRIGEIVSGNRAITVGTDLRLCRFFALSDGYWLRAQEAFAETIAKIKPWRDGRSQSETPG